MSKKLIFISIIVLAILALGTSIIAAQGHGNGPGGHGDRPHNQNHNQNQNQHQNTENNAVGEPNHNNGPMNDSPGPMNDTAPGPMNNGPMNGAGSPQNAYPGLMNMEHLRLRWANPEFLPMTGLHFGAGLPPVVEGDLPDELIELMVAGYMDEFHAYMAYGAIIEQLGAISPFMNLQLSEAQHMAVWALMFERYGVDLPDMGDFEKPVIASMGDACALGFQLETANQELYMNMLQAFGEYADIKQVITHLHNASEQNHLAVFENCVD